MGQKTLRLEDIQLKHNFRTYVVFDRERIVCGKEPIGGIEIDGCMIGFVKNVVLDSGVRHGDGDDDVASVPGVRIGKGVIQNREMIHGLGIDLDTPTMPDVIEDIVADHDVARAGNIDPVVMPLVVGVRRPASVLSLCISADVANHIAFDGNAAVAEKDADTPDVGIGTIPAYIVNVVAGNRDEPSSLVVGESIVAEAFHLEVFNANVVAGKPPSLGSSVVETVQYCAPFVLCAEDDVGICS